MSDSDEKEWRIIPEFPKYEMTFDGEVRTVEHKAEMTGHSSSDDPDTTVSLWREGGLVKKDIRGLIYDVYPEFKSINPKARLDLIKRLASEMQHWLGGESFLYAEFEQIADLVIDEGWRPPDE